MKVASVLVAISAALLFFVRKLANAGSEQVSSEKQNQPLEFEPIPLHQDSLKNSYPEFDRLVEATEHNRPLSKTIVSGPFSHHATLEALERLAMANEEARHFRPIVKRIKGAYRRVMLAVAPSLGRVQIAQIGYRTENWCPFLLLLTKKELIIYPVSSPMRECHVFTCDQLRWFGHPFAQQMARPEQLWLHFEHNGHWWVLRMAMDWDDMLHILAPLRDFAPALMPPYLREMHVHYQPVIAHRAEQQITGEWTLYEQRTLYLMPLYIVVLDGETVHELVPVESITHVASVPRLDAPGGIVRFRVAGEDLTYALDDYDSFAAALADAAKDSLEQPLEIIERKDKKARKE